MVLLYEQRREKQQYS